ncbi:hypothetical protein [Alicyclobacillus vulcanalis]|uniref:Uncharacterized protein n=1 Tax=Alicyclobacillus vulcanalis TaxID=252246 RepID=A0A1N7KQW6_9BACL|nr:hypothetical protein [Alicyclobacillus vulcanalis]SIS63941.1 hypothetical protein SAMN05421799_102119 [Alicyclobacillus vulcanalis]
MESTTSAWKTGVWRGWYWRFDLLTVVAIAALECIVYYASGGKYSFFFSSELGTLIAVVAVVQRAKEKRSLNGLVVGAVSYLLGFLFQCTLGYAETHDAIVHGQARAFYTQIAMTFVIALLFAWVYGWTTDWSERRRAELAAERAKKEAQKGVSGEDERPRVRIHRKKKRRGRGKRPKS